MRISYFSIVLLVGLLILSCNRAQPKQNVRQGESSKNQESEKDYLKIGYELMQNESIGLLKIGLNKTGLESLIGTPEEKSDPIILGVDGLFHQSYKYVSKGIELDLKQGDDSTYTINWFKISSPCAFKTLKGIGINSDIGLVNKEYQNFIDPKFSNDSSIVAGSIYGGIIFHIENKKVKSIFIGAGAE